MGWALTRWRALTRYSTVIKTNIAILLEMSNLNWLLENLKCLISITEFQLSSLNEVRHCQKIKMWMPHSQTF